MVPFNARQHPRAPSGRPGGGRFVTVHGDLPDFAMKHVDPLLRASAGGASRDVLDSHYRRARDAILKRRPWNDPVPRGEALNTLHHVHAAAVNPEGDRHPVGTGVPLAPASREPMFHGWDDDGGYRWRVGDGGLGNAHSNAVRTLQRAPRVYDVVSHDNGDVEVKIRPEVPRDRAHATALNLEIVFPQLRRNRIDSDGYTDDDRPLDLPAGEAGDRGGTDEEGRKFKPTLYPGVNSRRLGDAAELHLMDAVRSLREMGVPVDGDIRLTTAEAGVRAGADKAGLPALDWIAGPYGVEVKAFAFRGIRSGWSARGGVGEPKDDVGDRARKIAMAKELGLKPAIARIGMDLPNDTAYIFWHEYPSWDEAYSDFRVPQDMMEELIAGNLRPGESGLARSRLNDKYRWELLGAFPLRENPQRTGARKLTPGQMRELALERPGRTAIAGVPAEGPRRPRTPMTGRRESVREQQRRESLEKDAGWAEADQRIEDLLLNGRDDRGKRLTGAEIARRVKGGHGQSVSPQYVSNVKRRLEREGKLRPERKGPASKREQIIQLTQRGMSPRDVAHKVGVMPAFVKRIVDTENEKPEPPPERPALSPADAARRRLRRRGRGK